MLVVDAGALTEVVTRGVKGDAVRAWLATDDEQAAPHVIDVEVLGAIRRQHMLGELDGSAAALAVADTRDWAGERFGHRLLLDRAWELRHNLRGWDAMYVALAEILRCRLVTTDARLARATGPTCSIELV